MRFGKIGPRPLFKRWTARDYVQDGLIAMWDGIENAGWGVHDSNATIWKDLVGETNLVLRFSPSAPGYWNELGGWYSPKKGSNEEGNSFFSSSISLPIVESVNVAYITIEYCFKTLETYFNNPGFVRAYKGTFSKDTLTCWANAYALMGDGWNTSTSRGNISWQKGQFTTISVLGFGIGKEAMAYNSATKTSQSKTMTPSYNASPLEITGSFGLCANNPQTQDCLQGYFYNARIYNRPLTPTEIAINYQIDKIRFNLP